MEEKIPTPGQKPYILVIEDDRFLVRVYQAKLKNEGMEVDTAFDGDEALVKLKTRKPDLVILDLMLPKKSGFDVLQEIRNDAQMKDMPVFILSNLGQDEDIQRGRDLGVEEYLVKTDVKLEAVVRKIRERLAQNPSPSS